MTQKRFVSMIGALVVILGAVAFITGCPQANSNKGNTGNNGGSLEVQPTGKADSALKGTRWENNASAPIKFAENGNIANINIANISEAKALYTVAGEKISFDLSSQISNFKNMTEAKLIQESKSEIKNRIAELEKKIKEAKEKGDEQNKKKLEESLEMAKESLKKLENPDEEVKEEIKEAVKAIRTYASKMEPYAKFEGVFDSEKTQLTIEKFPHYDQGTEKVTVQKVIFKKNK